MFNLKKFIKHLLYIFCITQSTFCRSAFNFENDDLIHNVLSSSKLDTDKQPPQTNFGNNSKQPPQTNFGNNSQQPPQTNSGNNLPQFSSSIIAITNEEERKNYFKKYNYQNITKNLKFSDRDNPEAKVSIEHKWRSAGVTIISVDEDGDLVVLLAFGEGKDNGKTDQKILTDFGGLIDSVPGGSREHMVEAAFREMWEESAGIIFVDGIEYKTADELSKMSQKDRNERINKLLKIFNRRLTAYDEYNQDLTKRKNMNASYILSVKYNKDAPKLYLQERSQVAPILGTQEKSAIGWFKVKNILFDEKGNKRYHSQKPPGHDSRLKQLHPQTGEYYVVQKRHQKPLSKAFLELFNKTK